jgi:hypothetical protein
VCKEPGVGAAIEHIEQTGDLVRLLGEGAGAREGAQRETAGLGCITDENY